jgi:hypothetical protein
MCHTGLQTAFELVVFIIKEFVTMRGHMNVKKSINCSSFIVLYLYSAVPHFLHQRQLYCSMRCSKCHLSPDPQYFVIPFAVKYIQIEIYRTMILLVILYERDA